jgi:hypothetical protein
LNNPNALAALVVSQVAVAAEAFASSYLDVSVGPVWSKEIVSAGVVVVLYVGRHGLKSALGQVVGTAKRVWSGGVKGVPVA